MANASFELTGMAEFRRALDEAEGQAKDDVRSVLLDFARPMSAHATGLALANIPRITTRIGNAPWAQNRIGVTRRSVYIVPRKRGARDPRKRRPNFGGLLLRRSYEPTAFVFDGPRLQIEGERALARITKTIEFRSL